MKYGLIAGNGRFPFLVADGARKAGCDLSIVAIKEEADPEIADLCDDVVWIGVGKLGKMISHFRDRGVSKAIMAGQVKHVQLFSGAIPDLRMVKMLWNLPARNTDALIGGIADAMAEEGIELIDSTHFVKYLLAEEGVLTKRRPSKDELRDLEYGLRIASEIARLDLGQTIVVRGGACVAVEAMEGTDAVIRRAGDLAGEGLTVVKVSKPQQDMRFDVPVVGIPTIETMIESGARLLSVSAGETLMFDKEDLLRLADEHRICVIGSPRGNN